jgi:hypothetical protein
MVQGGAGYGHLGTYSAPDFYRNAAEKKADYVGRVAASGTSVCVAGHVKAASYPGGSYTMVPVKVPSGDSKNPLAPTSGNYWMNCKYMSQAAKGRLACR